MDYGKLVKRYRIDRPERFRLADYDAADCFSLDESEAETMLSDTIGRLEKLQEKLYANDRWSILIILQAMDAAGKDSAIKHVMSGVNPQGCQVFSFKAPSAEELDHDFLWRAALRLPERGRIGIFNRSYYEETLVVRVHPELLERQKLPAGLVGDAIWSQRFKAMRGFERTLARNGTRVLKFFLNVSKDEQRERFLARLEEPGKRWKFSADDLAERARWDDYMHAYEKTIRHTSTKHGRWHVVPADHKWFAHLVIAATIVEAMGELDLHFPALGAEALAQLHDIRERLLGET